MGLQTYLKLINCSGQLPSMLSAFSPTGLVKTITIGERSSALLIQERIPFEWYGTGRSFFKAYHPRDTMGAMLVDFQGSVAYCQLAFAIGIEAYLKWLATH